jgi:hypothetical protein
MQVENYTQNQDIFFNLRKNLIQYPQHYNPIVPPPGQPTQHHIFLISSDACIASYANTNTRQLCNAEIFELIPKAAARNGHWLPADPFQSLEQWRQVMKEPILCLRLLKNVVKGEEIFAYYQLPSGVDKVRVSSGATKATYTVTPSQPILTGTIALEGDDTVSAISDSPLDNDSDPESSEREFDDSTDQTSPNTSPPLLPTAPPQDCLALYSPDLDKSEFDNHLSTSVSCHLMILHC